ncbi:phosphoglycolate phosphatase 2-like isoform X1 [Miscanthus floridulus]|uniref:phosphoglycolate phosphatase 2-like isoform X1 n=1 Tax=Miscanthus floridulus TaxID=154761 RepID=UPI003458DD2E
MADNGLPNPPCAVLTADAARSLVDSVDAFLFDCDGVIWKGDKLIEGVPETMELLRKMGKKLVFVTNNSRKSRRQYSKKFRSLGLEVTEEEIFTSSFAAAMYLKLNNFSPEKKVYVVGEDGILEELKLAGFECFGGPEDGKKNIKLEADFYFEHDKSVGAVIVGLDQYFNYYKMQYARICISENPGCLFIATNRDPTGHMTSAQEWPGAGTMVAAVSCSVQKEPIVVGKPSGFLMDFLLKRQQENVHKHKMIGQWIAFFVDFQCHRYQKRFRCCSTAAASIWKRQGCAWLAIDWTQTYYLARTLVARPSLFCLVVLPYQNCRMLLITSIQISTRTACMI